MSDETKILIEVIVERETDLTLEVEPDGRLTISPRASIEDLKKIIAVYEEYA